MAVSKAQQKAVNKYMAANYDRVNLTLPKGQKEVVQAHAAARSESVNGFIGRAINETMDRDGGRSAAPGERVLAEMPAGSPQKAAGTAAAAGGISLPPDALEAAQQAAERTGETLAAFMARAVKVAVEMDERQRLLGINPVTGEKIRGEAAYANAQPVPADTSPAVDLEKMAVELWRTFLGMELRCYDPDIPEYAEYGAKGITICNEWRDKNGFSLFMEWCMENGYKPGFIIDRKDAAGPYSPENCILRARKGI